VSAFALEENTVNLWYEVNTELTIDFQENSSIDEVFTINIDDLAADIKLQYPDNSVEYSWDIFGEAPQSWTWLTIQFKTPGKKQISLNAYIDEWEDKKLIYNTSFFPLIYSSSVPLLYDTRIDSDTIENYKKAAEDSWVYLYDIGSFGDDSILASQIQEKIQSYQNLAWNKSNYIVLWWEKEFLFSILSSLDFNNKENEEWYNFVLLSWYNNNILRNYIENSIAWKNIVKQGFIVDDLARLQIIKHPNTIWELQSRLDVSSYEYLTIDINPEISPILFISHFIKEVSNSWVSNSDIYILLLIPIFLTLVAVFKHVIGISTLGSIIPAFMAVLFLKLWLLFTFIVIVFLLVFNLLIAKFISKYTLLYTPKVTFITIANIVFFMLFYQALQYTDLIHIDLENILYVVLFFVVSEKMISIICTKEFREYKKSLLWTIVVALICFTFFYLNSFLVFLFAYPEILLILIPFNFYLWRFTWLRITEYFRFNEIFKNIEE